EGAGGVRLTRALPIVPKKARQCRAFSWPRPGPPPVASETAAFRAFSAPTARDLILESHNPAHVPALRGPCLALVRHLVCPGPRRPAGGGAISTDRRRLATAAAAWSQPLLGRRKRHPDRATGRRLGRPPALAAGPAQPAAPPGRQGTVDPVRHDGRGRRQLVP